MSILSLSAPFTVVYFLHFTCQAACGVVAGRISGLTGGTGARDQRGSPGLTARPGDSLAVTLGHSLSSDKAHLSECLSPWFLGDEIGGCCPSVSLHF